MLTGQVSSNSYRARLEQLVTTWKPDIVQAELGTMAQYLAAVPKGKAARVLVEHDPGSLLLEELARCRGGLTGLLDLVDARAWARYERRVAPNVDAAVVFSERDRLAVARHVDPSRIYVIPPVVDLPAQPLDPYGTRPPSILFVGMFLHRPNLDAAERLVGSIFPRVRQRCDDVRLVLVGANAPEALLAQSASDVVVAGAVTDVVPFLDRATVVAAPLRLGSGVRVKVLEALAAGKAVVASSRAVEGLDVVDGEHVVLADEDADFAAAVVELLKDPGRRVALARAGRGWAERKLGQDAEVRAYESVYETLIELKRHA